MRALAVDAWVPLASENQAFTVSGTQTVRYGNGSAWVSREVSGSGECSNAAFGTDPLFGVVKQCQLSTRTDTGADAAPGWSAVATEGSSFGVAGTQTVRYGSGGSWISREVSGSIECSNAAFGTDPLPGVVKQCQVMTTGVTTALPTPAPASVEAPSAPAPAPAPAPATSTLAQICTPPVNATDTGDAAATVGNGTPDSCTEAALRSAVNAHSVVRFNCGAAPAVIAIGSTIDLPASRNTVIDGDNRITLDGGNSTRILRMSQNNYRTNTNGLTLQHITLRNARAPGGGYVAPDPGNPGCAYGFATGGGAAIEVRDARLHVIDVEFRDNAAASPGPDIGGGAIYAMGSLDILVSGSRFIGNSGANSGALGVLQSNLRVYNSRFEGNAATGIGTNYRAAEVASCPGVGHYGQGGSGGNAGAIGIDGEDDTDVTVCGSTFVGNRANELAGAIFRTANGWPRRTTIERSVFQNNGARQGGALFISNAAPLAISASTFSGNKATLFGGVHVERSQLDIVNSTFAGNETARGLAGALYMNGSAPSSVIRNVTFAGNKAGGGVGYFSAALFGDDHVPIVNTVFSSNTSDDPWNPMQCGFNAAPGANDLQWPRNRTAGGVADTPCVGGIAFADPLLGALADNGGPTQTLLPGGDSPLRNAGRDCPVTDQRGNPRNPGSCTIGAVE